MESTTVIITQNPINSESFTTKSILIVYHLIFGTASRFSSPRGECWIGLVLIQDCKC